MNLLLGWDLKMSWTENKYYFSRIILLLMMINVFNDTKMYPIDMQKIMCDFCECVVLSFVAWLLIILWFYYSFVKIFESQKIEGKVEYEMN